jgi:hypothetical protein
LECAGRLEACRNGPQIEEAFDEAAGRFNDALNAAVRETRRSLTTTDTTMTVPTALVPTVRELIEKHRRTA